MNLEAEKLKSTHPNSADTVEAKFNELHSAWATLSEKAAMRKKNLNESYALQKYLNDYRLRYKLIFKIRLKEQCHLVDHEYVKVLQKLLAEKIRVVVRSFSISFSPVWKVEETLRLVICRWLLFFITVLI